VITPSETREGEQWLSNFAPPDRPTAALLLDSVRIVSENRFRAALTAKLIEVAQNKSIWPVAIYPVHAISTGKQETEACPNAASLTEATLESAVHRGAGDAAPAESNAGLRGKVFPFVPQISFSDAGSALVCSNIIAEVVKTLDSPDVLGPVVVESLRATRVRTVLFVSDYLGSGQEAMRYLRAWWREPTVKSWYSGFAFRAELVTYGLATRAGRRLAKAPPLLRPDIHWIESGLDFESAAWTVDEHQKILALCRQYAAHPSEALGRSKSRGLFAMGHTLPNNLPAILRQDTGPGAGGWRPFVPIGYRRLSPVQQVELADYGPRLSFASQLRSIGADDLVVQTTGERDRKRFDHYARRGRSRTPTIGRARRSTVAKLPACGQHT